MKSILQTQREVIREWQKQKKFDEYVCPKCHTILRKSEFIENMYYCENNFCMVRDVVKLN
jgi:hypothetical protein